MSRYKSYLEGKNVILVGPASTLRGKGLGQFIDSHDVVVRLNHAWPLPSEFALDVGTRTDVIYHNLSLDHAVLRKKDIPRMREDGVQWLISTHPVNNPSLLKRRRPLRFLKINQGTIRFRMLSMNFRNKLREKVGGTNAGLLAMVDLLRNPITSLHVTGFSFYTTGYLPYRGYRNISPKMALRWHDQRRHKAYMALLLRDEKKLTVDSVMQSLLEEHVKEYGYKYLPSRRKPATRLRRFRVVRRRR